MRHNHKILKIGENEDECDRLKIIEEITTRLSAVLFNMYDEEFTKHIQVLNNIIGGEIEEPSMQYDAASDFVETSYSKKSTDTLPQEVPSKSNDKLSDNNNENSENPEMKTSKSNYNLLDENTSENFEVEFEISKKLLEDTDQKTLKTPIKCLQIQLESNKQFVEDDEEISIGEFSNLFEKKSKSSQSTAMEFQSNSNLSENYKENCEDKLESNSQQQFKHVENSKSNDTKSVKNNEQSTGTTKKVPLQQVKKSSRKIKKKEPFSPTIEKKHVTIDGTKKNVKKNESLKVEILKRGIKQTTTKVQSKTNEKTISEKDCQDLINKYRQKIVENVQDSRNASIDDGIKNLNIRKEVNVESSTKSAFVDMNRYKKKVTMMKWLNVNDIAINSSMKGEYFIQSEDLSNPTAQFLEISENDLRLLQDHLSAESYASLIDEIKVKLLSSERVNTIDTLVSNKTNLKDDGISDIVHLKENTLSYCLVDDIANYVTVDQYINIPTHKINKRIIGTFESNVDFKHNLKIVSEQVKSTSWTVSNIARQLSELLFNALPNNDISKEKLIHQIESYLNLIHFESGFKIEPCYKYSIENYLGAKVSSTKCWPKNSIFHVLNGKLQPITLEEEKYLTENSLDFSIFRGVAKMHLWLGTASYVNHSCTPNAKLYFHRNPRNICFQALRDIMEGEEISWFNGKDFFNPGECQCPTCKAKKGNFDNKENIFQIIAKQEA